MRPARRIIEVRGPSGKVALDEPSIAAAKRLRARVGYKRAIALLGTSITTFEKMVAGLPLLEVTARKLQQRIAEVA
jgi:hypothetical protein